MPLFGDASFFIALADPKDRWHDSAVRLLPWAEGRKPLHVHALVLAEVVAVIGSAKGGKAARAAYDALRTDARVHLPSISDLDDSMELVVRFDGRLSLSDALSLELMGRLGVREILSFDADFDGKGVTRRISPP
ncbi:MAG TPA: PIN domain-containing protein [Candidatus Thermoplasmatota archaeon]|nr:PIN domain-containing protein [Candidatus Thermoplasmatota archaeon]